ncbi:MAG: helix-turn-helix transcriptional regulator [Alphaproteobacteria bacterium]
MTGPKSRNTARPARTGKTIALSGLLAVQAGCAAFLLLDVAADLGAWSLMASETLHHGIELVAVVALIIGISLTALEIRRIKTRQQRIEAQLRIASGAFLDLLDEHFDAWALTPSERDVALLAIKGLSIAEIAGVRRTKQGTIKAQCNAIYSKAEVTGRQQLLSLFIEELMAERLVSPESARP